MIVSAIFGAALAAPAVGPVTMPTHFRGRYACQLATRREVLSVVDVWIDRGVDANQPGKGSIADVADAGVAAVRDAPVAVGPIVTKGATTREEFSFRSGPTRIELSRFRYSMAGRLSHAFLTVVHDPDETNQVPYETAAGFCVPVMPMAAPRQLR